mmetsp:Transcript_3091/g.8858  ORF Transcript_3091/g.8858 Transcript_3091/m.8858 type:complete len:200 (-) Transcript_3091:218-817(-)
MIHTDAGEVVLRHDAILEVDVSPFAVHTYTAAHASRNLAVTKDNTRPLQAEDAATTLRCDVASPALQGPFSDAVLLGGKQLHAVDAEHAAIHDPNAGKDQPRPGGAAAIQRHLRCGDFQGLVLRTRPLQLHLDAPAGRTLQRPADALREAQPVADVPHPRPAIWLLAVHRALGGPGTLCATRGSVFHEACDAVGVNRHS